MLFKHAITALVAIVTLVAGGPVEKRHTLNETVTYLGSQSKILCKLNLKHVINISADMVS